MDLQGDPLAFDVLELNEGLLGKINSMLGRVKSISKKRKRNVMWAGTYVVGLARGDVHHSRGVAVCDDVGGNSGSCAADL